MEIILVGHGEKGHNWQHASKQAKRYPWRRRDNTITEPELRNLVFLTNFSSMFQRC